MKRQTRMIWLLIMFVSILVFVSFDASCETVVGDPEERTKAGQIEYGGSVYRPRKRISTLLLIGIDKNKDEKQDTSIGVYRNGGQAAFLLLCVIDDNAKHITPLIINVLTLLGYNFQLLKTGWMKPSDFIVRSCGNIIFGLAPVHLRSWLYRRLLRK